LFDFPEKVRGFNSDQVAKMIQSLYGWEEQSITIVGPRSLKKVLEKYGDVTVKNYKKFL
jgi:zinc protease